MFDRLNRWPGDRRVRLRGGDSSRVLNWCRQYGVPAVNVREEGEGLVLTIPDAQWAKLETAAEQAGCRVEQLRRGGSGALWALLKRRWRLWIALLGLCLLLLWSKVFVWEIRVTGNETVSDGAILAALEECGVGIGSFWPDFTSDQIRSQVLSRLPQLRWLTVNIHGSRAEVIVRERVAKPEMQGDGEAADIVAEKDGFLLNMQTLKGSAQVQRGQAVNAGQLLIAGTVGDRQGGTRQVHALGNVTARTYYELSAMAPASVTVKHHDGAEKNRWALRIGDWRINFYKNSSISLGDCDKIISVYQLRVPGLFALPVYVEREQLKTYETVELPRDAQLSRRVLEQRVQERLDEAIDGGEVIAGHFSCSQGEDRLTVCLRAECQEDIGRSVPLSGRDEYQGEG